MSVVILRIAFAFYAAAAVAYVYYFALPRHERAATVGFWLLAAAFGVHAAAIGVGCSELGGAEFFSLRGGLVLLAWLVAAAYLILQRFYKLPTVGAFVTPFATLVLLPTLFGDPYHPGVPPETLRQPSVQLHIVTAVLGVALFAIACGVALMYLLQEREVKGKRFGVLFSRLPPLDSLDRLTQRLVRVGFVVFTIALFAGGFTARVVWNDWRLDPQQVVSFGLWGLYGGLVQIRHLGWHGKRFALMTMVGFALVFGSMVSFKAFPGLTRHGGDYTNTVPGGAQ
jgi:HemX protein